MRTRRPRPRNAAERHQEDSEGLTEATPLVEATRSNFRAAVAAQELWCRYRGTESGARSKSRGGSLRSHAPRYPREPLRGGQTSLGANSRARTSSHGTVSTSPDSISSQRRSASAAQSSSISVISLDIDGHFPSGMLPSKYFKSSSRQRIPPPSVNAVWFSTLSTPLRRKIVGVVGFSVRKTYSP